jgi:hypothetical protein
MAQLSWPWAESVAGDRPVTDAMQRQATADVGFQGVVGGLEPTKSGAGSVEVAAGTAILQGVTYVNDSPATVTPAAGARKDYIVVRYTAADREIVLATVEGSSSAYPTLTRTSAVYEIAVASVDNSAGAFTVADTRSNAAVCGLGSDHGFLRGLGDDDHTQYYNSSRHTKNVHDALALDHGALSGRSDDDHTQYYNSTRGDARYALRAGRLYGVAELYNANSSPTVTAGAWNALDSHAFVMGFNGDVRVISHFTFRNQTGSVALFEGSVTVNGTEIGIARVTLENGYYGSVTVIGNTTKTQGTAITVATKAKSSVSGSATFQDQRTFIDINPSS